ncbi:MAG: PEP-CTERM sorting domain-containing protein, partial [Vicinamibacterales bacterium]
ICLTAASPAQADLIDLGNGLIYDPRQDVTFVQDVRLARTLGQDGDGEFNWNDAHTWVANLTYAGYEDWRLPQFFYAGPLSENRTSEISRMLVHLGWGNRSGGLPSDSWGDYEAGSHGPFINLSTGLDGAWLANSGGLMWIAVLQFDVPDGGMDSNQLAWAVRDGGNPYSRVPEPSTLLLVGVGAFGVLRSVRGRVAKRV